MGAEMMESDKKPYPKWVGLVLGLILPGSAHFLSGARRAGVAWFLAITLSPVLALLILPVPGMATWVIALALIAACLVLYVVVLVRSWRPVPRIGLLGWLAVIAIIVAVELATHCVYLVVHGYTVPTTGMSPTIQLGNRVMTESVTYWFRGPARGEIVVFKTTGIPGAENRGLFVKRVAGLPGERIRVVPPNILVNGKELKEPRIFARISSARDGWKGYQLAEPYPQYERTMRSPQDEIVLGDDEYFMVGDNTTGSADSRYWGPVKQANIIGRATRIWWPVGRVEEKLGTD